MYNPQNKLMAGIRQAFPCQLFPWDDYFARMAETDFFAGRGNTLAVKSFFIRNAPFGGSYAVLGGITAALREIAELRFDEPMFRRGMCEMGYDELFVQWLSRRQHLRVLVLASPEGSVFFPHEPVITIFGPIPDIRLVEGIITEAVNFPTLSLTKWHRVVRAAYPQDVLEFSRRRAQHAMRATLYGMLGGCFATSNAEMRRFFDFKVVGTTGHEWMQSFGDIREAFEVWLTHQPGRPVGLVDTKQCLEYDFPCWLDAVWEHRKAIRQANPPVWGWRNDSGDLAELTKKQFEMLRAHRLNSDPWFAERARAFLTNELDEYRIASIGRQLERLRERVVWAPGTRPGTCYDQPSIGGVAKIMEVEGNACIKLAFDAFGRPGDKTSIPGFNHSALIVGDDGVSCGTLLYPHGKYRVEKKMLIGLDGKPVQKLIVCNPYNVGIRLQTDNYTLTPRQGVVFDSYNGNGFVHWHDPLLTDIAVQTRGDVEFLSQSMLRLENPQVMPLWVTPDLFELRQKMIEQGVLREDFLT